MVRSKFIFFFGLLFSIILISGYTTPIQPKFIVIGVSGVCKEFTLMDIEDLTSFSSISEYQDGLSIAFLPSDSQYSNEDCKRTSPQGEGYWYYPSTSYRWLRFAKIIRILSC